VSSSLISRRNLAATLSVLALPGGVARAQGDLPDPGTSAPTRGLDPAGRLTVLVFLNDKGPFPFLVDTGANASVISSDLVASLDLPPGRPVNLHGIAGVEQVGTVGVQSVRVGRRERRDISMSIIAGRYLKAPGVLGMDWLGEQGLTLDFVERQMHVGARVPRADQRSVSVPVRLQRSGLSLIDAHIGATRALTFLDTGSTTTVGNAALMDAAAKANLITRDWTDIQLVSLTGQTLSGRLAALKQLTLGKMIMRNVPVVFGPVHTFEYWGLVSEPALLIGVDVLRAFESVTLDYHRGAVHFLLPDASAARSAATS
jgi:predicted aspartyl protease